MRSIVSGMEAHCAGTQDGFTTTIPAGFTSNSINIITPSSTTVSCEFHFKNIPSDSPWFFEGGCKHAKNKSYEKFRENKRKEIISLLDKDSNSTTPSDLTKKMTGEIDESRFMPWMEIIYFRNAILCMICLES